MDLAFRVLFHRFQTIFERTKFDRIKTELSVATVGLITRRPQEFSSRVAKGAKRAARFKAAEWRCNCNKTKDFSESLSRLELINKCNQTIANEIQLFPGLASQSQGDSKS